MNNDSSGADYAYAFPTFSPVGLNDWFTTDSSYLSMV